jgi:hypothetical protein
VIKTNLFDYSIAGELLNYAIYQSNQGKLLSASRLERTIFGNVDSINSLSFWLHTQLPLKSCTARQYNDYMKLLYAFFIAMTDEEIYEISDSYFDEATGSINVNRSAM